MESTEPIETGAYARGRVRVNRAIDTGRLTSTPALA